MTHATTRVHYMGSDDVKLDLSVVHARWDLRQIRRRGFQSVIEDLARPAERGLMARTVELPIGIVRLQLAAEMGAHSRHSRDRAAVVDDHDVQRRCRYLLGVPAWNLVHRRDGLPASTVRQQRRRAARTA